IDSPTLPKTARIGCKFAPPSTPDLSNCPRNSLKAAAFSPNTSLKAVRPLSSNETPLNFWKSDMKALPPSSPITPPDVEEELELLLDELELLEFEDELLELDEDEEDDEDEVGGHSSPGHQLLPALTVCVM